MSFRTFHALAVIAALALPSAALAKTAATETQVELPGPLKGALLKPDGKILATALILPGSGPTNRDGDNPLGVSASTYRLLAEGLADKGVATLRMDKRGMFASGPAAVDPNRVFIADLAADANAWAAKAKAETGVRCVWLIGHSEGALVALVAAQTGKDLCGVVLVAGPGRPLGEVLRQQLKANPANAPILPPALKALDELEAGRKVDVSTLHPVLAKGLFNPVVQDFLIAAFRYDPVALARSYKGPLVVVQGTTDIQVSLEDARLLAGAREGVVLVQVAGANHLLKAAPADRDANVATYSNPSLPLAPGVVDPIADFLLKARRGAN